MAKSIHFRVYKRGGYTVYVPLTQRTFVVMRQVVGNNGIKAGKLPLGGVEFEMIYL